MDKTKNKIPLLFFFVKMEEDYVIENESKISPSQPLLMNVTFNKIVRLNELLQKCPAQDYGIGAFPSVVRYKELLRNLLTTYLDIYQKELYENLKTLNEEDKQSFYMSLKF